MRSARLLSTTASIVWPASVFSGIFSVSIPRRSYFVPVLPDRWGRGAWYLGTPEPGISGWRIRDEHSDRSRELHGPVQPGEALRVHAHDVRAGDGLRRRRRQ